MKKTISLLTTLALTAAMTTSTVMADTTAMSSMQVPSHFKYTKKFNDVPSDWAFRSITEMSIKGIINGDGLGKFFPGNSVSKEQAVIMTVRAMGLSAQAEALGQTATLSLTDAADVDTWARPYVAIALQNGILDANTTFDPKAPAEREWIAELVVRALGQQADAQTHMADTLSYKDATTVSANEVGYIAVASNEGILHGTDTGYILPHSPVKRNQMAVILCNAEHLFEYNKDQQTQTQGQLNGTVTAVSTTGITLKTPSNQTVTYQFSGNYYVFLGDQISNLNAIKTGMWVHVLLDTQGNIVFVQAKAAAPSPVDVESTAHGTVVQFTAPTATTAGSITISQMMGMQPNFDTNTHTLQMTLPVAANAQVRLDGKTATNFGSIHAGQNIMLHVEDNMVVSLDLITKAAYPITYQPAL